MANASIYAAFERMWQHVNIAIANNSKQPNWYQNDSNASDYIDNRTHYFSWQDGLVDTFTIYDWSDDEENENIKIGIAMSQDLLNGVSEIPFKAIRLNSEEKYQLTINDIKYETQIVYTGQMVDDNSIMLAYSFGNLSLADPTQPDTGEPFLFMGPVIGLFYMLVIKQDIMNLPLEDELFNFSLYGKYIPLQSTEEEIKSYIHTLDPLYLPFNYWNLPSDVQTLSEFPKIYSTKLPEDAPNYSLQVTTDENNTMILKTKKEDGTWEQIGGDNGPSLPEGGEAGQVLIKNSATDGDAVWSNTVPHATEASNAATANKLATARTISLTGDVSGSGSFDGSGDLTITATVADNSHNHNNYMTDSQSVPENSDFNAITKSGVYRYNNMTSYTNAPSMSWGQMLVLHGAGDTINQLAFDYSGANAWIRGGNGPEVGGTGSWYDWKRIWCEGNSVTGAVWNDYAECRESDCDEPGYVLSENGDDTLSKSTERLAPFAGVSSDTWGFSQGETEKAKTHIAVAGRVLVYTYQDRNNYKPGDCVCAAPGGTVDIMTREEIREWPDRIVGTVSCVPEYEEWGGGANADRNSVKVNGRIWIKVK